MRRGGKGGRGGRDGKGQRAAQLACALCLTTAFTALTASTAPFFAAQSPGLSLSTNPLTANPDSVVFRWPKAASGPATIAVYSVLGTPIAGGTVDPDPGRWVWRGTTSGGAPVVNGAYFVVVVRGDGARMRHRIIVAR